MRYTLGSLHRFVDALGLQWVVYYGSPSARYWTATNNRGTDLYGHDGKAALIARIKARAEALPAEAK
ncbi:MAG TPA: hypothetical protein VLG10_08105 [Methylomirabilota bacterium]|nr:hypothetical protein [Methylomirabilota bacterium]